MQIVQAIVAAAKKAGKASYVLSVDKEGGKVVHANHVPEPYRSAAFNAKTWAASISDVLGGKVSLILLMLMTYAFPFVFSSVIACMLTTFRFPPSFFFRACLGWW